MAEGQIDQFMAAIASIESGGAADPVNVQHGRTGAHGIFQIMPENWAPWAQEAGLSPNAPRTAENQRRVARHKMLGYYDQFGSWDAVAVAWFAGPGRARRYLDGDESVLRLSDGHSTVEQYVDKLNANMGSVQTSGADDIGANGQEMTYDAGATLAEVFGILSDQAAGRDPALRQSYGGQLSAQNPIDTASMMANTASDPFGSVQPSGGQVTALASGAQTDLMGLDVSGEADVESGDLGNVMGAPDYQGEADVGLQTAVREIFNAQARADGGTDREAMPFYDEATGTAFGAGVPNNGAGSDNEVLQAAEQYIGTPYVWGGSSPEEGFDCSGLVQYVFRQIGVDLPRTSAEQAQAGQAVGSMDEARPGDLVFWRGENGSPNHIGIYAGNGRFIEAPLPGEGVRYRNIGEQPDAIRRVM